MVLCNKKSQRGKITQMFNTSSSSSLRDLRFDLIRVLVRVFFCKVIAFHYTKSININTNATINLIIDIVILVNSTKNEHE